MRLIIKMIMVSAAMVGMASYGGYLMTGKPLWEVAKLPKLPDFDVSGPLQDLPSVGSGAVRDKVYKWRDSKGVLHYTSEPPSAEVVSELLEINANTNVIASVKPKEEVTEEPPEAASQANSEQPQAPLYTPEGVQEVLQQARDVQQLMNDRAVEQKKILDNL